MKLVGVKLMAECVSHAQIFIFMIISCDVRNKEKENKTDKERKRKKYRRILVPISEENGWQERH